MRPKIWPLLCAFLWLSSSNVSANDTIAELSTGGLLFKKSADISMLSEELFISLKSIRVKYKFKNNKPTAALVTVAFPLPDIGQDVFENNVAIPSPQHANFLSFSTKVNGVSQETKLELRAVHNGTDFSEHLRHLGVPITTQFAEAELALKNLSVDAKIDLSNLGLVSITPAASGDLITPRWAIKTTYYWEQLFPPKEIVEIEHAYQPSVGRAFDLALGLWMIGRTAHVVHAGAFEPFRQVTRDVAGPVIAEQSRFVRYARRGAPRCRERQLQRIGDVVGPHGRAQLPSDDVAGEVIEDGGEIEPTPSDHLEVGEVGLPELVGGCCLILELVGGLDDDEGWAGDQIVGLEQPIDGRFRDEVAFCIGEAGGQLAW